MNQTVPPTEPIKYCKAIKFETDVKQYCTGLLRIAALADAGAGAGADNK